MPYGNNRRLYHEARGVLYDSRPGSVAKFHSTDGNTEATLCYQLHSDRPIGAFRYAANRSYNFSINTLTSPDDIWIKEAAVKRVGSKE